MRAFLFLTLSVLWLASFVQPAAAQSLVPTTSLSSPTQSSPVLPEDLTPEVVRDVVSGLSDSEVRKLLLERLDAVAEENAGDTGEVDDAADALWQLATIGVASSVGDAVSKLPVLGTILTRAWGVFLDRTGPNGLAFMLIAMTIAIAGAALVELAFRRLIRGWVERISLNADGPSLRQTLSFLSKRLTGDIVAVMVFFVAAQVIGEIAGRMLGPWMLQSFEQGQIIVTYIDPIWFYLIVLPRLAGAIGRFLMAPQRTEFRIVHTDDRTARNLYLHQFGIAFLIGLTFWLPQFLVQNGETLGNARMGFWLNLGLHIYFVFLPWRYREGMSMMMRGPDPDITQAEAWAARAYPVMLMVASVVTWWLVEVLAGLRMFDLIVRLPHVWMLILVSFAPALDTVIRGLVRHLMPPMRGEGAIAERAHEASRRSYIRIGRVVVFAVVVLAIARIWQIDLANLASASVGVQVAGRLIEFLIIMAIGYLIYELVSLYINRKLAAEMTASGYDPNNEEMGGGDGGGAGGSRLSTVLPLILAVSRGAIITIFVLLGLSSLGVDTTPLLAGAGIVGLAIGFGAQKLVTDVVSGIFFLVDDAFRTGEYVEIEGTFGTVEKISIRSMQLRHHKGPVHTIPYGEIPKITNYSRDWVIMKLRFTVPFDTDPNKVKKIFKKIGADMLNHEVLGEDFLQPFKSQGVLEIDDVGMVIRGKFMAKPGKQFMIRKEIFNRVSAAFGENGIDFARREVRVALPGLDHKEELTEEDKAAIAAAATSAADAAQAEQAAAGGSQNDR